MSSKSEFYIALDHLKEAAHAARRAMPEHFRDRERKMWNGLLTRLPEQIDDIRTSLDDPHTQTDPNDPLSPRNRNNRIIIP
jgi:hypothetical protein